jgi:hypothetical protein
MRCVATPAEVTSAANEGLQRCLWWTRIWQLRAATLPLQAGAGKEARLQDTMRNQKMAKPAISRIHCAASIAQSSKRLIAPALGASLANLL